MTQTAEKEIIQVKPISAERAEMETMLAEKMLGKCQEITIATQSEKEAAVGLLAEVKSRSRQLEEERKKATGPLDDAKKVIMGWFKKPSELYLQAETALKTAVIAYDQAEAQKLAEAQRKLNEEAKKKEEQEKQRLLRQAEKAAEKGNTEKAEELKAKAEDVEVIAPVIQQAAPKTEGVYYRSVWKAEVVDAALIPREYLIPNTEAINKVAAATKGAIAIPGVRIYEEKVLSARSAR